MGTSNDRSNGPWRIRPPCRDTRYAPAPHGRSSSSQGWRAVDLALAVPLGQELRGQHLATYLLIEAADGYRVVFALPELDPAFTDREVLLADRRDGQPLAAAEGPLRLVVPGEKRHARWIRQVLSCTIRRAP